MSKSGLLAGKRALVTGGASGIGRAIVKALSGAGARIAVTDKNGEAAAALAREIGGGAISATLDVTSAGETAASLTASSKIRRARHPGRQCRHLHHEPGRRSDRGRVGCQYGCQRQGHLPQQPGRGSPLAQIREPRRHRHRFAGWQIGAPLLAHYSASKFAVVGSTQALAREVGKQNIRVNCVCPGFVRTGMQEREIEWEGKLAASPPRRCAEYISLTPLGRIEEPEDVADIVLFLASDLSRFLTGEAVNASGGVLMD
jgi:NAD(P)-dependent dehydrogenase (short-subunit alcohol dehydrogenase family)